MVTLNGFSVLYPAGPITLDNIIVDNIGPRRVEAEFSNIVTGPGPVNFARLHLGQDVTVCRARPADNSVRAHHLQLPTLPARSRRQDGCDEVSMKTSMTASMNPDDRSARLLPAARRLHGTNNESPYGTCNVERR